MQHKCKVTVLKTELYKDLQEKYLADPRSGPCTFYKEGQEFLFERYGGRDDFWQMGKGSQCAEAWDAISRYIYTALQGGSIMRGWTNDEKIMIACCNDGTRPVVFKIERIDYKVLYATEMNEEKAELLKNTLVKDSRIEGVIYKKDQGFTEVILHENVEDNELKKLTESLCSALVTKID